MLPLIVLGGVALTAVGGIVGALANNATEQKVDKIEIVQTNEDPIVSLSKPLIVAVAVVGGWYMAKKLRVLK